MDLGHDEYVGSSAPDTVRILGVRFDSLTMDSLVHSVIAAIQRGEQFTVSLANPEIVLEARRNRDLKKYLSATRFTVADGIGIVWASRFLGHSLPERVTGTDFVRHLAIAARENGLSMFLYGGRPTIGELAASKISQEFPGITIAGTQHGYLPPNEQGEVVERINSVGADIVMVCLGAPKQEKWIATHLPQLRCHLIFGNGGALDFWSGITHRAPIWMQRAGLEWLFRLFQDFSLGRIRRQLRLPAFVILVIKEWISVRLLGPKTP